jgi:DNA invertase Pin-like site-specific DNA recombinase
MVANLSPPWADTTTPAGRPTLTVLGGLAEFERELIKIRTSEGRERAKRAGVKMGRKPILSAHQIALQKGKRRIRPLSRKIIPS